jgi:hypothetical protein
MDLLCFHIQYHLPANLNLHITKHIVSIPCTLYFHCTFTVAHKQFSKKLCILTIASLLFTNHMKQKEIIIPYTCIISVYQLSIMHSIFIRVQPMCQCPWPHLHTMHLTMVSWNSTNLSPHGFFINIHFYNRFIPLIFFGY